MREKDPGGVDRTIAWLERIAQDAAECRRLVLEFFSGDNKLAERWFATPNPSLGGGTPDSMIGNGAATKLLRYIQNAVSENGNREL